MLTPVPDVDLLHRRRDARQLRQELRAEIWLFSVPQFFGQPRGKGRRPSASPGYAHSPVLLRGPTPGALSPLQSDCRCVLPFLPLRIRRRMWWPISRSWWTRAPSHRAFPRSATPWTPVRPASEAGGGMEGRVRVPVGRTREGWRDDWTGACFPSHDRALGDDRAGCGVEPCSGAGPHALPCVKMCGWHSL